MLFFIKRLLKNKHTKYKVYLPVVVGRYTKKFRYIFLRFSGSGKIEYETKSSKQKNKTKVDRTIYRTLKCKDNL